MIRKKGRPRSRRGISRSGLRRIEAILATQDWRQPWRRQLVNVDDLVGAGIG